MALANPIQNVSVDLINNRARDTNLSSINQDNHWCICLKNTQTDKIYNRNAKDVKLFSSTDCTGNYSPLVIGKTQNNAQWVNSASIGKSGIPSVPPKSCPNYFQASSR
ncbi:hypothetical protein KVV02_007295 [Mortierella alpina]|uniref:Uncharacterized protein n=1 Tax=Mortierella alpina TaxID=64518 RepID=A0A9P7ZX32_MORAP|nr:hypothetical protein KVV02_007295 [Mortierella alpina]